MESKNYENTKIEDDVYFYLHKGKYGEFTYLLSEIFQRRAYQYGIDERQIEQEIKRFADNVDKIEIVNGPNSLNAQFFVKEKKIEIYSDNIEKQIKNGNPDAYLNFFQNLSHEVYHAIYAGKNQNLMKISSEGKSFNYGIDESVVEKSSFDTVFNSRIRRETNGNQLISSCSKLLSIALGISEKDFLKKGIKPYSSLNSFLENPKYYNRESFDLLDEAFEDIDVIYNIFYNPKNAGTAMTFQEHQMLKEKIGNFCARVYDLFTVGIENSGKFTLLQDYGMTHRFNQAEYEISRFLDGFSMHLGWNENDYMQVMNQFNGEKRYLRDQVLAVQLLQNTDNPELQTKAFLCAQKGDISEIEGKIEPLKRNAYIFSEDPRYFEYGSKEFDNDGEWNNQPVEDYIKEKFFKKENWREIATGFLGNLWNRFKNIGKKKLTSGIDEINDSNFNYNELSEMIVEKVNIDIQSIDQTKYEPESNKKIQDSSNINQKDIYER